MSQPTSWVPLVGPVSFERGELRYEPRKSPCAEADSAHPLAPPTATARCNLEFEEGEVSCSVKVSDASTQAKLVLGYQTAGNAFIGVTSPSGLYGVMTWDGKASKWEVPAIVGAGGAMPVGTWVPMRVAVRGSDVRLFVSDVEVAAAPLAISRSQLAFTFSGPGEAAVKDFTVTAKRPRAFVAMQFSANFDALHGQVIRPVCEEYGFEVLRADEETTNGLIIQDIAARIREASLVIADVTPNNPNVFYEVGYAHALEKPTILLCDRKRERLPFDLSGFRTIFYEDSIGGKLAVEERLRAHVAAITRPDANYGAVPPS